MKISSKPILLADDDQVDVMTVMRTLKEIHITKPVDYKQFIEVMRSIDAYWTISEMTQ